MTEVDVQRELIKLSGLSDFLVLFKKEYNPHNWGAYYIQNHVIVIYILNKRRNTYADRIIMRTAIHELAHHIQYFHTEGYYAVDDNKHDKTFCKIFNDLLNTYFDKKIPKYVMNYIKRGGYLYEEGQATV
jgi:predicted SprT family Zn-dependent metalloprotease